MEDSRPVSPSSYRRPISPTDLLRNPLRGRPSSATGHRGGHGMAAAMPSMLRLGGTLRSPSVSPNSSPNSSPKVESRKLGEVDDLLGTLESRSRTLPGSGVPSSSPVLGIRSLPPHALEEAIAVEVRPHPELPSSFSPNPKQDYRSHSVTRSVRTDREFEDMLQSPVSSVLSSSSTRRSAPSSDPRSGSPSELPPTFSMMPKSDYRSPSVTRRRTKNEFDLPQITPADEMRVRRFFHLGCEDPTTPVFSRSMATARSKGVELKVPDPNLSGMRPLGGIEGLAQEIIRSSRITPTGRLVVPVSGLMGAGKTTLGLVVDAINAVAPGTAALISMDTFLLPRDVRYGKLAPPPSARQFSEATTSSTTSLVSAPQRPHPRHLGWLRSDYAHFGNFVRAFKDGQTFVEVPKYDEVSGRIVGNQRINLPPIVILEGCLANDPVLIQSQVPAKPLLVHTSNHLRQQRLVTRQTELQKRLATVLKAEGVEVPREALEPLKAGFLTAYQRRLAEIPSTAPVTTSVRPEGGSISSGPTPVPVTRVRRPSADSHSPLTSLPEFNAVVQAIADINPSGFRNAQGRLTPRAIAEGMYRGIQDFDAHRTLTDLYMTLRQQPPAQFVVVNNGPNILACETYAK